jgi:hypothetical protein
MVFRMRSATSKRVILEPGTLNYLGHKNMVEFVLEELIMQNGNMYLKYGSEEKGSSLYKCSILLGFILSKNLRGL